MDAPAAGAEEASGMDVVDPECDGGTGGGIIGSQGEQPWISHQAGVPPEGVTYDPDIVPVEIRQGLLEMLEAATFRIQGLRQGYGSYAVTSKLTHRTKAPKVMWYFANADGSRPSGYDFGQAVEEYLFELPAPPELVAFREWLRQHYNLPDDQVPNAFIAICNDHGQNTFAPSHQDKSDQWEEDTGFFNAVLCGGGEHCPRFFKVTEKLKVPHHPPRTNGKTGKEVLRTVDEVVWCEYLGHGSVTRMSADANSRYYHQVPQRGKGEKDGVRYSLVGRVLLAKATTDGEPKTINYLVTNPADFGYPTDKPVTMVITKKNGDQFHVADKANQREREMKFQQMVLAAVENKSNSELQDAFEWGHQQGAYQKINRQYWEDKIAGVYVCTCMCVRVCVTFLLCWSGRT
jgi:hypothetical protein